MTEEQRLEGGSMTVVVRVGDTVRRPATPKSGTIQALLRHLESEGFESAPRALGFDEQNREILGWIEGELGFVWGDEVLPALGSLMRRRHDAAATFVSPASACWLDEPRDPVETICHNDIVPWNTVYRDGLPVAFIDWDFAAPGPRVWDLAFTAAAFIPLADPADAWERVPTSLMHRATRLRLLLDGYGTPPSRKFVDVVVERLLVTRANVEALAASGREREMRLIQAGMLDSLDRQVAWIRRNAAALTRS